MEEQAQQARLNDGHLSVGRVAAETGISPGTLRVWQRRYGNPVPLRLPSGHRRYTHEQLAYLRLVAEGLARGLKPSKLLRMEEGALAELVRRGSVPRLVGESEGWLQVVRSQDTAVLQELLESKAQGKTTTEFLQQFLAPLLEAIGRGWVSGTISIRHEHFASEVIGDYLRARRARARVATPSSAPTVVLATLPDERHTLGLSMASLLVAEVGLDACILGADTPVDEIVSAVEDRQAGVLAISISLASGGPQADRLLSQLRSKLNPDVSLVVGGSGARRGKRGPRGVVACNDMVELEAWLRNCHSESIQEAGKGEAS